MTNENEPYDALNQWCRNKYIARGYFPPPWKLTQENQEKTDGWCAFQDEFNKDPLKYQELWTDAKREHGLIPRIRKCAACGIDCDHGYMKPSEAKETGWWLCSGCRRKTYGNQ